MVFQIFTSFHTADTRRNGRWLFAYALEWATCASVIYLTCFLHRFALVMYNSCMELGVKNEKRLFSSKLYELHLKLKVIWAHIYHAKHCSRGLFRNPPLPQMFFYQV